MSNEVLKKKLDYLIENEIVLDDNLSEEVINKLKELEKKTNEKVCNTLSSR